jgi:hypothetical protein
LVKLSVPATARLPWRGACGRQQKLIVRAGEPAQAQPGQAEVAFHIGKAGFDHLPLAAAIPGGLGDIQLQTFLSPSKWDKQIVGIGPVFQFPSATNGEKLRTEKWSAGPGAVALVMPGVVGGLVNNFRSPSLVH